jgi:hypothetical protein
MENVPKIVRARLQRPASAAAEPHPDADLLTAFAEQSLAAGERDHLLEHLARCGECRDVVALALPATESAALASHVPVRAGWLSLPVLRWGVVAAGIALVASFGILQYRQRQQGKTLVATSLMSHDQTTDPAAQSAVRPLTSAPTAAAPTSAPAATDSRMVSAQSETRKQNVEKNEKKSAAPSEIQSAPVVNQPALTPSTVPAQPQTMRRSNSAGAIHGSAGFGSASGVGRSSTVVEVSPYSDAEPAPPDQLQALSKAKPASPQASAAMVPAPLLHAEPTLVRMKAVAPRWTISDRGALQRSIDGGTTWQDVDIAVNNSAIARLVRLPQTGMSTSVTVEASSAAIEVQTENPPEAKSKEESEPKSATTTAPKFAAQNAGKAAAKITARPAAQSSVKSADAPPAPSQRPIFRAVSVSDNAAEVWAGGSGGALYHTVDAGNHWTLVVPSDVGLVLAGDVIAIQFSNPRNGSVTTSTAEVWTTVDAGQTWHKQ